MDWGAILTALTGPFGAVVALALIVYGVYKILDKHILPQQRSAWDRVLEEHKADRVAWQEALKDHKEDRSAFLTAITAVSNQIMGIKDDIAEVKDDVRELKNRN